MPQATSDAAKGHKTPRTSAGDSVEISNNTILAREISAPDEIVSESPLLSPERLTEIRARVSRSFYDNPAALNESANNLIASFKGQSK
jgi:hypothetical protein